MEEKLKELAELVSKLEMARKTIREGIDSPLVEYDSSAYGFLMSAEFSLGMAITFLYDKKTEMVSTYYQKEIQS